MTSVKEKTEIQILTADLKKVCAKVAKGVKNDKILFMTSLIKIKCVKGIFSITSTDLTTNVEVKNKNKVTGSDFEVLIAADAFIKLISKTTSNSILLWVNTNTEGENTTLSVKGNGNYNFEIVILEDGEEFPNFDFEGKKGVTNCTIKRSIINTTINNSRPAAATDEAQHILTGIYFSDEAVSSNSEKVAATKINVFNREVLLRPETINLIDILEDEDLQVLFKENRIIIFDTYNKISTAQFDDAEAYPYEAIQNYVYDSNFESKCILPKNDLLAAIDRLTVFNGDYRDNPILISFSSDKLTIMSKNQAANEEISYCENSPKECKEFVCGVEAEMLKAQVQVAGENVELHYGNDTVLKITDGNLSLLISLLDD